MSARQISQKLVLSTLENLIASVLRIPGGSFFSMPLHVFILSIIGPSLTSLRFYPRSKLPTITCPIFLFSSYKSYYLYFIYFFLYLYIKYLCNEKRILNMISYIMCYKNLNSSHNRRYYLYIYIILPCDFFFMYEIM